MMMPDQYSNMMMMMMLIIFLPYQYNLVSGLTLTDRPCNLTLYTKNGCEEPETTFCHRINSTVTRCACNDDSYHVLMGRFCVEKICPDGQRYDRNTRKCIRQSRASSDVGENHCRYDYHCYGTHVTCRPFGWNFNCVCDAGFRYDEISGKCEPKYGIGGHCVKDSDCDETDLRMMMCQFPETQNDSDGQPSAEVKSGTCQCQDGYRYNYNIDGCEALSTIARREHNMRTLVLLFVATGLFFGLAMTCNFGLWNRAPKEHEIILRQLRQNERLRRAAANGTVLRETGPSNTIGITEIMESGILDRQPLNKPNSTAVETKDQAVEANENEKLAIETKENSEWKKIMQI